jgi:RNA polymerase sigma factor (sigma-70 family)
VLNDVVWKGAVLPDEIRAQVEQLTEDQIKHNLQTVDTYALKEYWRIIEQLRPYMLRVARLTSLMIYMDPEDIVHDAIVRLSAPPHLERLSRVDEAGQRDYVYSMMRRMLLSQENKAKRDFSYMADPETDEDWDDETNEFIPDEPDEESADANYGMAEEPAETDDPPQSIPLVSTDEIDDSEPEAEIYGTGFEEGIEAFAKDDTQLAEKILSLEMRKILSDKVWQMVKANYIQGYSINEIAAREGKSPSDVKNIIDTARKVLREHYAEMAR